MNLHFGKIIGVLDRLRFDLDCRQLMRLWILNPQFKNKQRALQERQSRYYEA